jgi:two-component system cell cycle sensor histidine kinase/response regulator CckA
MSAAIDLGESGLAAFLEAAPDGILLVDEEGTILLANQRAEELFGYPQGALEGMQVDELVPERFRRGHRGFRKGYTADPHPRPMGMELDLYGRRRGGAEFPVEISLSALRTDAGMRVITIVRDVTERRALEAEAEALRQRSLQEVSDAALRNLSPDALLGAVIQPVAKALDADLVSILLREPGEETLHVRAVLGLPESLIGRAVPIGTGIGGRIAQSGAASFINPRELVDEDLAELVPASVIGTRLMLASETVGVVIAGRTKQPQFGKEQAALLGRLAERIALAIGQARLYQAAANAESRLREILDDIVGIVWEADDAQRHRFTFVSEGAEDLLGYPTEDWTETEGFWAGIVDPADRDRVMAEVANANGSQYELEYRVRTADGRTVWLRDRVRASDQGWARGLMVDVTEQRELEANLLHAQKMQAVGQLAGGVAHDFNNMLTAIIGYAGLLSARLQERDDREDLAEIERAAKRAQGLTEQLLSFSRRQAARKELLDLAELVGGMEPMLRRLIDEDIDLALQLGARSVLVEGDPGRLEQALVNLVINARDAMPAGGTLNVIVETTSTLDGARFATLRVIDTGTGMDEQTRSRVFEPFFTTKAKGRGTGLGLSTVYGVVDQAGGQIAIDSEPGKGTEVKIMLPMAPETEPEPESRLPTVLIVEDEEALRRLVRRVLEADGKRVLEAADGRAALAILDREGGEIDLLITDVVMPGMSGPELVEHVTERWPDLRIVYSSGYTDSRLAGRGFDEDSADLLRKPYTVDELRRRVAQELGADA